MGQGVQPVEAAALKVPAEQAGHGIVRSQLAPQSEFLYLSTQSQARGRASAQIGGCTALHALLRERKKDALAVPCTDLPAGQAAQLAVPSAGTS